MLAIREGTHFEVDVWPRLGVRAAALLRLVTGVFVLAFACVFLWWGWEFTRFAFNRVSELAELPLWMIHVAWPLAGATWLIFAGERMWDDLGILIGAPAADDTR
jgi:TRAP-type C4-dicarboxylate transport system permease small subunit